MTDGVRIRLCADSDLVALEATEPPGAGIARGILQHQAAGGVVYAAAWRQDRPLGTVVVDLNASCAPELKHLFVQESVRGDGIGTSLCVWAEACAVQAGFAALYLRVGADNDGARRLYERLGFTSTGRTITTSYEYIDDDGRRRWATENDETFVKVLPG